MKVAIVIVNYRTPDLVIDCLKSLLDEADSDRAALELCIFIGDAQSGDGSTETISQFIRSAGLGNALCYDIGQNGGFAFGNNHILHSHVLTDPDIDYVHFLNPDTYIHRGAVQSLVRFLRDNPTVGVAGSRLENPDASLRAYAFRFPAPWREFFRGLRLGALDQALPSAAVTLAGLKETREVDWVTGASFMVPRQVLDEVGLMDPDYFLYFEEVDFMARIRAAGYQVWHVAESRVVHLAGQATGMRAGDPPRRLPSYWFHSRFKFFCDRYGWARAVLANLLFLTGDAIYRGRKALLGQKHEDPPHLWRDFLAYGFSCPPWREPGG